MNSFFRALLEAKGEKTTISVDASSPDDNVTDYSADDTPSGNGGNEEVQEPSNTEDTPSNENPADEQSDNDVDNQESGESGEDDNATDSDGATDYSSDMDDALGDGESSDTAGGDSTPPDNGGSTDEPPEDENFSPEDAQKNQVLYQDFCYFFEQINRIEKSLSRGSRRDMLTTQVYSTVTDNIRRLKDDMFHYMTEVFVGRTYAQNLYQFNSYIEALRLNIQMLKKIGSLNANS